MRGAIGPAGIVMGGAPAGVAAALRRERLREHDLSATRGGIARPGVDCAVAAGGARRRHRGGTSCSTELSIMWLEVLGLPTVTSARGLRRAFCTR